MPRVAVSGRVAKVRPVAIGRVANSRTIPVSRFGDVLQMANKRPVFTPTYYAVDGTTGRVGAFIDWNDPTHTLAQSAFSLQVLIPVAHADFNNKLCADFPNASTYYTSSRVPAYWTYLVNESTSYLVHTPKGTGFALWVETGDNSTDWSIQYNTSLRGLSGRSGTDSLQQNGAVTANVPLGVEYCFSVSQGRRSVSVTGRTEAQTLAPIAGAFQSMVGTLTVGGRAGLGLGFSNMRWAFFSPMDPMGPQERAAMRSYILTTYGLVLP